MTTRVVWTALLVCLLAVPALAAKERGNRTKCSNNLKRCVAKVESTAEHGVDVMERIASHWKPVFEALLADGDREEAAKLGARVQKLVRHRGHVTVLEIQQTVDTCVTALRKHCADDDELVAAARAVGARGTALVEKSQFVIDSFFDV